MTRMAARIVASLAIAGLMTACGRNPPNVAPPSPGLSFGGTLEIADFCCPEFLDGMAREIRGGWNRNQNDSGTTVIRFVILRDSSIGDVQILHSSGKPLLDLASRSAIPAKLRTGLPAQFKDDQLAVRLAFEYRR
jgi:hypothetical protein